MGSLEIKLKMVTPIWTGGADGKSDRLHITGIIGSLRWWYEVMIRSVGGNVCDPSTHSCLYDSDKPHDGLCDVCRIFGATGWARRFRLTVSEDNLRATKPGASAVDVFRGRVFSLSRNHPASLDRGHRWYLSGDPLYGQFKLNVVSTAPLDTAGTVYFDPAVIGSLIQFIADRASIGAKPQMGLGVAQVVDRQSTQPLLDHLAQIISIHQKNSDLETNIDEELPCLQNMFFARVDVPSTSESATFDLKYDLRNMLRETFKGDDQLRHTIMGYVKGGNRIGAKVMMSFPYEDRTVRVWGWIPRSAQLNTSRDTILNEIYYFLKEVNGDEQLAFWLDFDPQKNNSMVEYIEKKLLVGAR